MLPQTVSVAGLGGAGERLCRAWQALGIKAECTLPDAVPPAAAVLLDMPAERCLPFLQRYIGRFEAGTVFCDTAEVKAAVVPACEAFCAAHGMHFVGAHIVENQFILTPTENTAPEALHTVQALAAAAGYLCVFTTPEEHDARIAFTEQLPRLLAAAYVQSGQAAMHRGFSDAACRNLALQADTDGASAAGAMLQNKEQLSAQVQDMTQRLQAVQQMLQNAGPEQLAAFLRDGQNSFLQYFR